MWILFNFRENALVQKGGCLLDDSNASSSLREARALRDGVILCGDINLILRLIGERVSHSRIMIPFLFLLSSYLSYSSLLLVDCLEEAIVVIVSIILGGLEQIFIRQLVSG